MIYVNGKLLADGDAHVDPTDRGFTLGDGLYETIAVRHGYPVRLGRHLARLRAGAEIVAMIHSFSDTHWAEAVGRTIAANEMTDGVARLTLTRGPALRGLMPSPVGRPTLVIATSPAPPHSADPADAIVATDTRRNEFSPLSGCKTTSALDSVIARMEAADAGVGEAILLNTRGFVAEGASTNVFAVIGGRLVTPPVTEGALPGVMRAAVMAAMPTVERPLTLDDLKAADEAFLTNSLGVRRLRLLDGRPVGAPERMLATGDAQAVAARDD